MGMPKSTKLYQKNQKYRFMINSISVILFGAVAFIILQTGAYLWLGILSIPVVFGIPVVATLYLDYFLSKRLSK